MVGVREVADMTCKLWAPTLAAILFSSAVAMAQTPPLDMRGTWQGNNEGLVDGPATHHPGNADSRPAGKFRIDRQTFTYTFDGQDGRLFWGTMGGEFVKNIRMLGTLSIDGKWIYMVNKEGYIDAQIIDPDTIEACYRHVNAESAVVGCNLMRRKK
jgi:hypothetical protein